MARMVMLFFSGGVNDFLNYPRYKNDILLVAETMLFRQGASLDDLHILYGVGGETFHLPGGQVIARPATREALQIVLADAAEDLTSEDTFFFLATNHGSLIDESSHTVGLYGWNEEVIENWEFAEWCKPLKPDLQIFVFGQCFSGGFLKPLSSHKYVVLTACQWNEPSYQSSSDGDYDEFILRFVEAIEAGAETYKDAFDRAGELDQENETPQFSDPGKAGAKTSLPPIAKQS